MQTALANRENRKFTSFLPVLRMFFLYARVTRIKIGIKNLKPWEEKR